MDNWKAVEDTRPAVLRPCPAEGGGEDDRFFPYRDCRTHVQRQGGATRAPGLPQRAREAARQGGRGRPSHGWLRDLRAQGPRAQGYGKGPRAPQLTRTPPATWTSACSSGEPEPTPSRAPPAGRRPARLPPCRRAERTPGAGPHAGPPPTRENALWKKSALIWFNCLTQKNESLTVEERFVQGFCQENTRKTNIYSTAPIFMFFANYMR